MAQELSAQVVKGVQGIGYVCAFLLSLVICVPMSMHQDQFKGRCLLFSTGLWQEKDGQFKVICSIHSTPVSNYTSLIIYNLRISTMNLLNVSKINVQTHSVESDRPSQTHTNIDIGITATHTADPTQRQT